MNKAKLRTLKRGLLHAAERALAAYRDYQQPHTAYLEHQLLTAVWTEVAALFAVMKKEPLLFFGPRWGDLGPLGALGDAAREVYRFLNSAMNVSTSPDVNSKLFAALFGDLHITAEQLREELTSGRKTGGAG
jgi:hypothetical protein